VEIPSKMDVSIVIVNWNTCDLLRGCLRSICDQTRDLSFEIFVVDNASRDGSAEMVRTEFPEVNLIANTENRGFAAGNNQAIRKASGRYILLLNPDTIVLDAAISRCVRYADARPDVGVVGCQVLVSDRALADRLFLRLRSDPALKDQLSATVSATTLEQSIIQRTGFAFPSLWGLFVTLSGLSRAFPWSRFVRNREALWDFKHEQDLDVVSGVFMLVRREALDQVGLLDESYFIYQEEVDWCYRFAQAGWHRVFTPCAQIIHLDGGANSTSQVNVKMFVQMQKSQMIYFRKHLGYIAWLAATAMYVLSNAVRATVWFVSSMISQERRLQRKALAAVAALRFHLFRVEPT